MTVVNGWSGTFGRRSRVGSIAVLAVSSRSEPIRRTLWLGLLFTQMAKMQAWRCVAIGTRHAGRHEPGDGLHGDLSHTAGLAHANGNIWGVTVVNVIGAVRPCTVLTANAPRTITSDPTLGRSLVGNNTVGNWAVA